MVGRTFLSSFLGGLGLAPTEPTVYQDLTVTSLGGETARIKVRFRPSQESKYSTILHGICDRGVQMVKSENGAPSPDAVGLDEIEAKLPVLSCE